MSFNIYPNYLCKKDIHLNIFQFPGLVLPLNSNRKGKTSACHTASGYQTHLAKPLADEQHNLRRYSF